MAHVRRWDDLIIQLLAAIATLFFFHPVVWLSFRAFVDESDRDCDAMVTGKGRYSPEVFRGCLTSVIACASHSRTFHAAPTLARSSLPVNLRSRLRALPPPDRKRPATVVNSAFAVLLGGVFLPMDVPGEAEARPSGGDSAVAEVPLETRGDPDPALLPVSLCRTTSRGGEETVGSGPVLLDPVYRPIVARPSLPAGGDRPPPAVLLTPSGSGRVQAAAEGMVEYVGVSQPEKGQPLLTVIIEHPGGLSTVYGGLGHVSVQPGDAVRAGRKLGSLPPRSASTTPVLHLQIRLKGALLDPGLFRCEWRSPTPL
jgi:hypothetical protein